VTGDALCIPATGRTGYVGKEMLRPLLQRPALDLVRHDVSSPKKFGKATGSLAAVSGPDDRDGSALYLCSDLSKLVTHRHIAGNGGQWTTRARFYVSKAQVKPMDRIFALEGGTNFRDLGGYPTEDGRRVKWRRLFRSGNMEALTARDLETILSLGLKFVCDFRSTSERERSPFEWAGKHGLNYWTRDHIHSLGNLQALMRSEVATPAEAHDAMCEIYRELPKEQAPAYRELFRMLAADDLPLVFNCSAGKDRTGLAAALVLTTLCVPHEAIVQDYLLSNQTFRRRAPYKGYENIRISPDIAEVVGGTHADFLATAFATIEGRWDSVSGYLRRELGVTQDMVGRMQANLLEVGA
jgi:protein-tyrosine phosphatase